MPSCLYYAFRGDDSYSQRRAEARRGCRVGVTKPTVAARKAARKRRSRSR